MKTQTLRSCLLAAVLALPLAAAAQSACQFLQVAQVPLHYAGSGLGLTMTGEINGKRATMLPDTGAGVTYLTRTGVERHGLTQRAGRGGQVATVRCEGGGVRRRAGARP